MYKLEVNGELHIVYKDDFPTLVEEYMGGEAARIVEELVKESNYNEHKLNSDLVYYESQLNDYQYWAIDIQDLVDELLKYLNEANRVNRNKIRSYINRIGALTDQIL